MFCLKIIVVALILFAKLSEQTYDGILTSTKDVEKNATQAKTYIVNLDLPPFYRWTHIASHFNSKFIQNGIDQLIRSIVPSAEMISVVERIAADLDRYISEPYSDEMRGISAASGVALGDVVLSNIIYDLTAYGTSNNSKACTSIVTTNQVGQIIHGRDLDYNDPAFLRNITMQVDFQRGGKSVYMASTFAGYVGVLTGCRHGAFSVSGDERDSGMPWMNLISALEGSQFTFFVERKVLDESSDYPSALNQLINTPTIAPVYFILGGLKPGEGAIIVRNGEDVADVVKLGDDFSHPWFLVETNYDPWKKPPKSDDRRDAAIASMNKIGKGNMNVENLYKVLSTPPVFNYQTVYTTIMSASNSSVYRTMIRYDAPT